MNRYIPEEFHSEPILLHRLAALAHRERAQAVRDGLSWLKARLRPRIDPARLIGRLG